MATSPSLVYASLHGRTGNTANLSTTEPKKTNQSIQSSCRNNPEYDNMPMSLIIKDKVLKKDKNCGLNVTKSENMAHGSKYIKKVRHPDVTRYDGEVTVQEETVDLKKKKRGKYAPYGPRL